jgi:hypothetical protein
MRGEGAANHRQGAQDGGGAEPWSHQLLSGKGFAIQGRYTRKRI